MGKHLLIASGGGHLKQLHALADRIGIEAADQVWVTFDTGLSRSLLADREVVFATYAAPRDAPNIFRNWQLARRMLRERIFESAISTGASLAVSFLPLAARRGIPSHYIESAARADGPSLTGRIVARDKRVSTYAQYPAWSSDRWQYRGSIFDSFAPGPAREAGTIRRVVVTVGTTESYAFDRLFTHLVPLLRDSDVLWQVGTSDVSRFGIDGREAVPHDELVSAIKTSDVIIAHSGTGAAITAMEHGRCPVLVPRRSSYGEHVDDHQLQIAAELSRRGLAVTCEPEQLNEAVLRTAAARSVAHVPAPPRFVLDRSPAPKEASADA